MRRLLAVGVLALLMVTLPAHAQEQEQELQDIGFIQSWDTEVVFPSGVWFSARLREVTPLQSATLELRLPDGTSTVLAVPIEPDSVDFEVVWEFPRANPPTLYTEVGFTWRFVGLTTATANDTVVITDARRTWTVGASDAIPLTLVVPEDATAVERLLGQVRPIYEEISAQANSERPAQVMLYPNDLVPGCEVGEGGAVVAVGRRSGILLDCDPAFAERIYADYIPLTAGSRVTVASAQRTMAAFWVDWLYESAWAGVEVPGWLRAGLAELYTPTLSRDLYATAVQAGRTGGLYSLEQLENRRDDRLWTAQSYALVLYIADTYGLETLYTFARDLRNDASVEEAFTDITGDSLQAAFNGMTVWLFTDDAVRAFALNLYIPSTPTETATATATATATRMPFTPPPTPTRRPTRTPTLPAFVTFVPPTRTPTRTPMPATPSPTITARPASALFTATPTATPTEPPLIQLPQVAPDVARTGVIVVIIVAIVIIVLVLVWPAPRE